VTVVPESARTLSQPASGFPDLSGTGRTTRPVSVVSDRQSLTTPYVVVTVIGTDPRMSNLMQDGVAYHVLRKNPNEVFRQTDGQPTVTAPAQPGLCSIELKGPTLQLVLIHETASQGSSGGYFHTDTVPQSFASVKCETS
jgi:hypothetical protein